MRGAAVAPRAAAFTQRLNVRDAVRPPWAGTRAACMPVQHMYDSGYLAEAFRASADPISTLSRRRGKQHRTAAWVTMRIRKVLTWSLSGALAVSRCCGLLRTRNEHHRPAHKPGKNECVQSPDSGKKLPLTLYISKAGSEYTSDIMHPRQSLQVQGVY